MTIRRLHHGATIAREVWDEMTPEQKTNWLNSRYNDIALEFAREMLAQRLMHVSVQFDEHRAIRISCDAQVRTEANHRWLTAGEVDREGTNFRRDSAPGTLGALPRDNPLTGHAGDGSPSEREGNVIPGPPVDVRRTTSPSGVRGVLPGPTFIDEPSRRLSGDEIDALLASTQAGIRAGNVTVQSTPTFRVSDIYATFASSAATLPANTEPSGAMAGCDCTMCEQQRQRYAERE